MPISNQFTTLESGTDPRPQALLGATERLDRALEGLQSSLQDHRAPKTVAGCTAVVDAVIAFAEAIGESFGVRIEWHDPDNESKPYVSRVSWG